MVLDDDGSDLNAMTSSTFEKVTPAARNVEVKSFNVPVKLAGRLKQRKEHSLLLS